MKQFCLPDKLVYNMILKLEGSVTVRVGTENDVIKIMEILYDVKIFAKK